MDAENSTGNFTGVDTGPRAGAVFTTGKATGVTRTLHADRMAPPERQSYLPPVLTFMLLPVVVAIVSGCVGREIGWLRFVTLPFCLLWGVAIFRVNAGPASPRPVKPFPAANGTFGAMTRHTDTPPPPADPPTGPSEAEPAAGGSPPAYPLPCVGCGYDLRAADPAGRCPECGAPVADALERGRHAAASRRHAGDLARGLNTAGLSLLMVMTAPTVAVFVSAAAPGFFAVLFGVGLIGEHVLWRSAVQGVTRASRAAGADERRRARRAGLGADINLGGAVAFVVAAVASAATARVGGPFEAVIGTLLGGAMVVALAARVLTLRDLPGTAGSSLRRLGHRRGAATLTNLCGVGMLGSALVMLGVVSAGLGLATHGELDAGPGALGVVAVLLGWPIIVLSMLAGGVACLVVAGRVRASEVPAVGVEPAGG